MKLPISWLRDYVDFDDTVEGLCDKLTFSGVEVEGVETHGGDFKGLVVGEIRAAAPHPDADRLQLCTVFDGENELQVICGAPNARAGLKSAFAPVGAKIAGRTLKKAKLRGVESFGMLCSSRELGLSGDHSGIMELAADAPAGSDLASVLPAPETVLDLEITPNRPDCLSILGLAREIAALYGTTLKRPDIDFPEDGPPVADHARVELRDPACPRYTARVLDGIAIGPSPDWMQRRLELCDIRPINNAVDITNYVMLETGQPLHAFDHRRVADATIVVRAAGEGETMTTLDGQEHTLSSERLLICDAEKPVALAGVMGGANSEIADDTTKVLLESAAFDAASVRATAKTLGVVTESSYRFARGCDVGNVDFASRRAAALLVAHAGATACAGVVDEYPEPYRPAVVRMGFARCDALIGVEVPRDEIERIFRALELDVVDRDTDFIAVRVPSFRLDLARDVDLIEEVARMHGLDRIPARTPSAELVPDADDTPYRAQRALRGKLVGLGLQQAMNYSLVDAGLLDKLDPGAAARRIVLPNPMSARRGILRTSLIPQMVESLGRNRTRQVAEAALFEIGPTFRAGADGYEQTDRLCLGLLGPVARGDLDKQRPVSGEEQFLALKGVIEQLGAIRCQPIDDPVFETGAEIVHRGQSIGKIGVVAKALRAQWRMHDAVAVAELDLNPLLAGFGRVPKPKPISEYPAIQRDAALVLDRGVSHEQVLGVIKKAAPKELVSVRLFDIYEGDKLPAGKRSLAYAFTYQSLDKTLTDDDGTRFHNKVKKALRAQLGAEVPEDAGSQ